MRAAKASRVSSVTLRRGSSILDRRLSGILRWGQALKPHGRRWVKYMATRLRLELEEMAEMWALHTL